MKNKMKIDMITFHTPKNYGAVLQAVSLMKTLEQYAEDVQVIDYNTPHLRSLYPVVSKPNGIKSFIKMFLMLPTYHNKKKKYCKFDAFVKENLNLTQRLESTDALYDFKWDADLFVTGSDQVFNPRRISDERKAFYLDFVPETAKRISYAGSFGCDDVPDEQREEISRYLNQMDSIAVREKTGVQIVKELTGRSAALVLDPVFLNDRDFWKQYESPYEKDFGKYLFYYRLMNDRKADQRIQKIAEDKNLKLVVMTDDLLRMKADYVLRDVGPREFLFLMSHADFIVTNAFHGVAFSLIYQKQFVFSDTSSLTNGRGRSVLEMLGIEETAYLPNYNGQEEINYDLVNIILRERIKESKMYLKENILYPNEQ